MEMGASFGEWRRSASHVLSFSTSVLLFRGVAMQISLPFGYRCFVWKEKWRMFSVVPYPPSTSHTLTHPFAFALIFFFFLFFWSLPWTGLPRKEGKKQWKINREAQSDPVVSVRFPFQAFEEKHLSGGGMRPNCSQSLLILSVQSPHGAEGEGRGCCGWELQTPSFDLPSALMSFETCLVFIKPFGSAVQGHSLTNYQPPWYLY